MKNEYDLAREKMVKTQLIPRGIGDLRVLRAMRSVHREQFVPEAMKPYSYYDSPLGVGEGQTISQPYIVALMTEALELRGDEKVLEIGTGSGYQAAVLSELSKSVYTVERVKPLFERAGKTLKDLGYANIHLKLFDGTLGWEEFAPFNAVIVTAAAPEIPEPLIDQLDEGGRLIVPVGTRTSQELIKITRKRGELLRENLGGVRFVSLIGEHGWSD